MRKKAIRALIFFALLTTTSLAQSISAPLGRKASPGDWPGFQSFLDVTTSTRTWHGGTVEPLIDGQIAFPDMLAAIDKATSSVNWSVYLFAPDATGQEVARHLAGASDRGCQVRLLYDGYGSAGLEQEEGKRLLSYLQEHKVELVARDMFAGHITHRKILVVDGGIAFLGGMNVADSCGIDWHDVHCRVTGPVVADVQRLFVAQWEDLGGHISKPERTVLFPKLKPTGETPARVIGHVGGARDNYIKLAYLHAINSAAESITIGNPYFADRDIVSALSAAARRGVDVRLILPQNNDMTLMQLIAEAYYIRLVRAGVKVFEYQGRMAHGKVAVFDHSVGTIGSSNLDPFSLRLNDEANVWFDSRTVSQQLEGSLIADQLQSQIFLDPSPVGREDGADVTSSARR